MSENASDRALIEAAFARYGYPEDFLSAYDQLECLSSGRGRETFLVRGKADGALAVAKCYDRSVFSLDPAEADPTQGLSHPGLPRTLARFQNDATLCVVRAFVPGKTLAELAKEGELSREEIVSLCTRLGEILEYLHTREQPVIHRDIKPENVVVGADGSVTLIDFDIARTFKPGADSDTVFFGTKGYAPPEQYGFAQTDARADIYSFGVLLRFLLTGSVRENPNVRLYRPLEKIIAKCTAFSPEDRCPDMKTVLRALSQANPRSQFLRKAGLTLALLAACGLLILAGVLIYRAATYTPFTEDHLPAFLSDEERVTDAVSFMKTRYGTALFDDPEEVATVGDLRALLIECYGLERDYVYGINDQMPQESPDFFLPWGWDDGQTVDRDVAVYAAVKVHDPERVADWSSLKDDNGFYPGVRVAVAFAEEAGLTTGVNRPNDISRGELALIFANADRIFEGAAAAD